MNRAVGGLVAVAFAVVPLLAQRLTPNDYEGGRSRDVVAGAERNTSALAQMLGQFRTAMSDIMYIKTELYLHSGVAYEPHLEAGTLATVGVIAEIDEDHADASTRGKLVVEPHDHDHDHDMPETIIPTATRDWRGYVGYFHRKVKPWRDPSEPHLLTDGREMLPWFRVMTMTDPHFVRGYAVGAWWLKRRNLDAAIDFAREGVANNPAAFEIMHTLGELHMEKGRRANNGQILNPGPGALEQFLAARAAFRQAADIAVARRPAGWVNDPDTPSAGWADFQEDDARAAAHMAVLTEKSYGDPEQARALARRYLEKLDPDEVLRHNAE